MGLGTAVGHPQHSAKYNPEIWSSRLLIKFYKASVYPYISNTDYEGEIQDYGDKVKIRDTPDITIRNYVKGQKLNYENPNTTITELDIDKAKYWSFNANRVDERQSDIKFVDDWTEDASEQLKITIDTDILGAYYADAHASNKGLTAGVDSADINLGVTGSPLEITSSTIINKIIDLETVCDEQSLPGEGRYLILPPWACGMIKKSDLKDASLAGDGTSILRSGRLGIISGFTLFRSRNIAKTTDGAVTAFNMIFGQKSGLTFASQLVHNEVIPNPDDFGFLHRGLQVFGYKVVKPEAVGHLYAYKG